ncbi:hypothetical protein ABPG74_019072 [Tetrahymena malaccensis]
MSSIIKDSILSDSENRNQECISQNEIKFQNTHELASIANQNQSQILEQAQQDDSQLKNMLVNEKQQENVSSRQQFDVGTNKNKNQQPIPENEVNLKQQQKEDLEKSNNLQFNNQNQANQQQDQQSNSDENDQEFEFNDGSILDLFDDFFQLLKEKIEDENNQESQSEKIESQEHEEIYKSNKQQKRSSSQQIENENQINESNLIHQEENVLLSILKNSLNKQLQGIQVTNNDQLVKMQEDKKQSDSQEDQKQNKDIKKQVSPTKGESQIDDILKEVEIKDNITEQIENEYFEKNMQNENENEQFGQEINGILLMCLLSKLTGTLNKRKKDVKEEKEDILNEPEAKQQNQFQMSQLVNNNGEQVSDQTNNKTICQIQNQLDFITEQLPGNQQQFKSIENKQNQESKMDIDEPVTINKCQKEDKKNFFIQIDEKNNQISKQGKFDEAVNRKNEHKSAESKQNQELKMEIDDPVTINKGQKEDKKKFFIQLAENNNEISKQGNLDEIENTKNEQADKQKQILSLENNNLDYQIQNQIQKSRSDQLVEQVSCQNQQVDLNKNELKKSQDQSNEIEIKQQQNQIQVDSNKKKDQNQLLKTKKFRSYSLQYLFIQFYDGDKFVCDIDISVDYSELDEYVDLDIPFFYLENDNQNIAKKNEGEVDQQEQQLTNIQNPNNIDSNSIKLDQNDVQQNEQDQQNQVQLASEQLTQVKQYEENQNIEVKQLDQDSQQQIQINDIQNIYQINSNLPQFQINNIQHCFENQTSQEKQANKETTGIQKILEYSKDHGLSQECFQECKDELQQKGLSICEFLKKGGFGAVYKGFDTINQRDVAIKLSITSQDSNLEQTQQIFEDMKYEKSIIDQIKCYQYVVKTFDLFITQKYHTIIQIMEYCETDLQSYIESRKINKNPLNKEETIDIYFQLINALIEIHANDIVHLDIKPLNILRTKEGIYKLTDFGISQLLRQDNNSYIEQFKGFSEKYSSPEQYQLFQKQESQNDQNSNQNLHSKQKFKKVSQSSDVFSMGLTFLYILQLELSHKTANQIRNGEYEFDLYKNSRKIVLLYNKFQINFFVAQSLSQLGASYTQLGNDQKALEFFNKALSMREALYQGNHPDVAQSLSQLGVSYGRFGNDQKALEFDLKALGMREALYQGNHPDVAQSLSQLGVSYGRFDKILLTQIKPPFILVISQGIFNYLKAVQQEQKNINKQQIKISDNFNQGGFALYLTAKSAEQKYLIEFLSLYRQVLMLEKMIGILLACLLQRKDLQKYTLLEQQSISFNGNSEKITNYKLSYCLF